MYQADERPVQGWGRLASSSLRGSYDVRANLPAGDIVDNTHFGGLEICASRRKSEVRIRRYADEWVFQLMPMMNFGSGVAAF